MIWFTAMKASRNTKNGATLRVSYTGTIEANSRLEVCRMGYGHMGISDPEIWILDFFYCEPNII